MVRSACNEKAGAGLKKGAWSPQEDQKLLAYIEQHGHGNWTSLPAKAGLQRCGKSCRLRWCNYLRPGIKRGKFTVEEDQTIIQLHALLGNRWSAIAAHVAMRTDNQIKNYWNTCLKKRLTKMGIDPMTHKPNSPFGFFGAGANPKDAANLSHMAQWETARLQAEARFLRKSKLVVSNTSYFSARRHYLPPATTNLSNAPAPPAAPPCLDVLKLKAWQQTWKNKTQARTTRDNINDIFGSLRFSDQNLFAEENSSLGAMENPCMPQLGVVTRVDSVIEEDWNTAYPAAAGDYSSCDHMLPENTNYSSTGELGNVVVVANCGGATGFEDNNNNNDWNNILNNLVISPAASPVF